MRTNPQSDLFKVKRFHHVEFLCVDATKHAVSHGDLAWQFDFSAKHGLAVRAIVIEVENADIAFNTSMACSVKPSTEPIVLDTYVVLSEVYLYGDVVLRYISYKNNYLEDHNCAKDVDANESVLNAVILANNKVMVLLATNEQLFGSRRRSQVQIYLEYNKGAGVQLSALASEDIFRTLREMRKRSCIGEFEFMPSPPSTYYKNLKNRAGDVLSDRH
ncbi:unnamed protein product [Dovyalis caffra]|uniref:4-hydroxyphenylpyruvate dioxygenase n=1 Tax=Dovyalis caffra TaxID=77055 RepID=A0AAV1S5B4_9ROSI|nr:unnamed protein product [Dovyalis caffra]